MDLGQQDNTQLKENIYNFSLDYCPGGNQGYNRVLLQLFGFLGHGKSSLINSCIYTLEYAGEFKEHAEAQKINSGCTIIRESYELTNNITLVDNRGYSTMDNFKRAEVYAQLGNFMPLNEEVEWKDNYTDMMRKLQESEKDPNYTDFIVPVLVYNVRKGLEEKELREVKLFIENCGKMTGVAPIIVLTHKTRGNYIMIEQQFMSMGADSVISLENYTKENRIKTEEVTRDILLFINRTLRQVQYRMEQGRNWRRERVDRKKFVLKYIHEIQMMKMKAEFAREQGRVF
ncbi:uncharacterized protein LOC142097165 [Mixophyes fleayi]|uniref:uncharacterized protein LOC142097165 n=1 Tax=Mixophyes fleayi TaxID=3061075 RepID=UPI003F4D9353